MLPQLAHSIEQPAQLSGLFPRLKRPREAHYRAVLSAIGISGPLAELASIGLLAAWAGVLVWIRLVHDTLDASISEADRLLLDATWFAQIGMVVLGALVLCMSVRRSQANARRLFGLAIAAHEREVVAARDLESEREALRAKVCAVSASHDALYELLFDAKRQVEPLSPRPLADPRLEILAPPAWKIVPFSACGHPHRAFSAVLRKSGTDWSAAQRAAVRIRKPGYSLRHFYVDCRKAFPEIDLCATLRSTLQREHTPDATCHPP